MTVKSHDLAHIRCVVLAGHAGSGKTTLAEQVLFRAGAIPRLGRVDDGTAHLDYEPEEQKRHQSLSLAVGTFEHGEHEITVVDTPGYPDFIGRDDRGLPRGRRGAVRDGRLGRRRGRARGGGRRGRATGTAACFVLNKCDRENADPTRGARRAARGVRRQDRAAPHRDRRRGHVQRLRRPRPSQGLDGSRAARRSRSRSPTSSPTRWRGAGTSCSRRRPRPTTTCSRSTSARRRSPTPSSTRASTRASASRSSRRCWSRRRAKGIGLSALLDAIVRYLPSPEEEGPYAATDKAGKDRRGRPRAAASCSSACSRPRRTRSSGG